MNKFTRKIEREYQAILLDGAESYINENGEPDINVPPMNIHEANDYLVKAMHGLSQEELDDLEPKKYRELLDEAKSERDPKE